MLGENFGTARGTALSSAGTINLHPILAELAGGSTPTPRPLQQSGQGIRNRKKRRWPFRTKKPRKVESGL